MSNNFGFNPAMGKSFPIKCSAGSHYDEADDEWRLHNSQSDGHARYVGVSVGKALPFSIC